MAAAPTDPSKDRKKEDRNENLFEIMDGIILQLNKTKRMFILMIITILILPPISFVITFAIFGPPMFFDDGNGGMRHEGFKFGPRGLGHEFALARVIPILIFIIWLGIGIRNGLFFQNGPRDMSAIRLMRNWIMINAIMIII